MKNKFSLLYYIGILLVFISCSPQENRQKVISVTIQPQKYFAEKIAGDRFEINCIVPSGSNPEVYDPTPSQLVNLGKSVAYFKIGYIGFELAQMKKLEQNNPKMKIYDTSQGVELITSKHIHHNDIHHHHFDVDPHIWCSPKNAKIIAKNMYEAFVELDPAGESSYYQNYMALLNEISQLDSTMTQQLAPVAGRTFAIYHPSLSYLAQDYGLEQLPLESYGKEPSPATMQDAVENAKERDVSVIFIQQEFDAKQAETFAQETGAKVVPINPLSYNWSEELLNITHALTRE